jgi:hypothetical protein
VRSHDFRAGKLDDYLIWDLSGQKFIDELEESAYQISNSGFYSEYRRSAVVVLKVPARPLLNFRNFDPSVVWPLA